MSESIRKYKNNDEIIKELESRNLIFPDEYSKKIFKSYLEQYGYFSFVKKLSHNLMYLDVEKKIYKDEFTSNNVRYLFDIDRNISVIIFKYFRNIEFLLNSSIMKVVAKKINKHAKCPYIAALNNEAIIDIWPNIDKNLPKFKKLTKSNLLNFFDDLFKNINNVDFDCHKAIEENIKLEKNEIKDIIENGWFKNHINNQNQKKMKIKWEYLDIFSLFQSLSFSQLIRVFSHLSTSSKNEVIKIFFNYYENKNKYIKLKEDTFLKLINIFSDLRNILMHNGCLIKFSAGVSEDEKNEMEKYFNIVIKENKIKLKNIIDIIHLIVNLDNNLIKEIKESINYKFNNRTKRPDKISTLIFEIIENETDLSKEDLIK